MPRARKKKTRRATSRGRKALVVVSGNKVMVGYARRVAKPGVAAKVKGYNASRDPNTVKAGLAFIITRSSGLVSILSGPYHPPPKKR